MKRFHVHLARRPIRALQADIAAVAESGATCGVPADFGALCRLPQAAKLPVEDLGTAGLRYVLRHVLIARDDAEAVGAVGTKLT